MKNKIKCIIICTLLIATSTVVTVSSNENQKIASEENNKIDNNHSLTIDKLNITNNNISTLGDGFEECIAACMGITLAGNCIYLVFACAISPGPHNFCCWAAPIFCGVDIGLLISCIAACTNQLGDFDEEPPCFPPGLVRVIRLIQNSNNSGPAIILGLLCLLQRSEKIKEWLKDHGVLDIDIPDINDCGCIDNH